MSVGKLTASREVHRVTRVSPSRVSETRVPTPSAWNLAGTLTVRSNVWIMSPGVTKGSHPSRAT